ncbi:MAG: arylsulfatase A-like enzyme [Myxococcota bacterium]|jgi:arylsulfatase A-like enzyme
MSNSTLDQRWPWLLAAAAVVAASLFTMLHNVQPMGPPGLPAGISTIDEIAELKNRDDVNVLFILIDTLRADRLGSYGYERDTSPYLDSLANSGVRFQNHLSQSSWTKASMASMWTSVYPWRTGVTRFDDIIPEEAIMPAETLRDAGFRTIGIWRNGWVAPTFGFQQGFEVYSRPQPLGFRKGVLAKKPTLSRGGTDEDVTASAIEFFRVHSGQRWFLYLHLMDIHEYTFDDQSALFGSSYSDVYDNSIRWTDETIKILMEHLVDQGYGENTMVVVTSDHGEAFMERGFEGHGRRVYKESTEVPLLISFPFQLDKNVVVESRSRNIDIWPTLFDLLGVEGPEISDGRSLVGDIMTSARGEAPPEANRVALSHLDQNWGRSGSQPEPTVAVADGPLRYVRGTLGLQLIEDLFDASSDPAELESISATQPETLERLRAYADEQLSQEPAWGEAPTRAIGEMELNQLRAIGYDVGD